MTSKYSRISFLIRNLTSDLAFLQFTFFLLFCYCSWRYKTLICGVSFLMYLAKISQGQQYK